MLRSCCFVIFIFLFAGTGNADESKFVSALESLKTSNFTQKAVAVDALAATGDARALHILQSLASGALFYRKDDGRIVIAIDAGGDYVIKDALTNDPLGTVEKRDIKKIGVNNALRSQVQMAAARMSLAHPDDEIRLAAVQSLYKELNPASLDFLRSAVTKEQNDEVARAMRVALALNDIGSANNQTRLQAISILSASVHPDVHNRLSLLLQKNDQGEYTELEAVVRQAAARALQQIDARLDIYRFLENVFFGLSLGSVLLLAAIGLAITFGVMGVINMAHGELIMLGAYTTYVVQLFMPNHIGLSILVAIPLAFLVSGLVGIAIERGVIRFLYGRPLETLLATFGISLILQQLVRTIFSPLNRSVATPEWMSGSLQINDALSLTYNRLYVLLFALAVFFALLAILKKTSLGLQVRAVSQNRAMARAMGVRSEWIDALTFGLGSGIAGVAGVALSQLTNVGPNLGQSYIIDSFMVVVFGGVGNLWGTLIGAFSLGIINKFLEPWSGAVLAKIIVLAFIIMFIQKRPRGLFPQKGRAAEG